MADVQALFDKYDENKDGSISAEELLNVVREMELPWTNKLVSAMIRERQVNAKGVMDLNDFTKVVKSLEEIKKSLRNPEETQEAMVAAFNKIDKNGDGFLSHDELREGLSTVVGMELSAATIAELVRVADANSDGQVDVKEFVQMVTSFF
ncbi:PREDICTED: calmodulin-4-like [Branchiostoma belcheri]|uniref:Calmodulin-4-like n=1 Tax=Branchiostoma belcheri TaxID=7741 RepID=A0A6P4YC66_BRABE|nr:PREDICTED: calmodulin-4-like [Branchiostoma belcheri]